MKYRRILIGEVQPGDDVLVGPDIFRVFYVEPAQDATCLYGRYLAGNSFSNTPPSTFTATRDEPVVLVSRNVGLRVKMAESHKDALRKECKDGKHTGPFENDDGSGDCWGCSTAHVEEFGDAVGVVEGVADYNNCKPGDPAWDPEKLGPEFTVVWPENLRYHYALEDLDRAP